MHDCSVPTHITRSTSNRVEWDRFDTEIDGHRAVVSTGSFGAAKSAVDPAAGTRCAGTGDVRTATGRISAFSADVITCVGKAGLYRSANRGRTWQLVIATTAYLVTTLEIDSASRGYWIGNVSVLRTTVDAGVTWTSHTYDH